MISYIKYFLVKYDKKDVTLDEIKARWKMELLEYYNKWGKDGFLSENFIWKILIL